MSSLLCSTIVAARHVSDKNRGMSLIVAARAYLLHLLGCTLFANKSATHVHVIFLDVLSDMTQSGTYAWGVAALVHMYDNLNEAACRIYHSVIGYFKC